MRARIFGLPTLRSLLDVALALLLSLWLGSPSFAQAVGAPKKEKTTKLSRQQILEMLNEDINLKDFPFPMKLCEVTGILQQNFQAKNKVKLTILIDSEAFRSENPDTPPVEETTVTLPTGDVKRMTVARALEIALSKVPTKNADYLIRNGQIEITTTALADPQALLAAKVLAVFQKKRFGDAIDELSEQSGMSIAIDPRITEKLATPISATFVNKASLHAALTILCDMVGAQPLVLRDVVYITTPENAQKLQEAQPVLRSTPKVKPEDKGPGIPGM